MSVKINAEHKRGEMFFINPADIVADEKSNGRWQMHSDEAVLARVKSYEYENQGQLQPCTVRKVADNKVSLVIGFLRWKAAMKYNELHPDAPMKLKCVLVALNDEEALVRNITENEERDATTIIDKAHNQRRLREDFGWTDSKIAEFYRMTQGYVSQIKKLVTLPTDIQLKVHRGEVSVQSALAVADLPAEQQREIIEMAPSTKEVQQQVRKRKLEKGKKVARSLSEVRDFFSKLLAPQEHAGVRYIADRMMNFIKGGSSDEQMKKELAALFGVTEAPRQDDFLDSLAGEEVPATEAPSVSEEGAFVGPVQKDDYPLFCLGMSLPTPVSGKPLVSIQPEEIPLDELVAEQEGALVA